jgi:hypothetical protein
VGAGAWRAVEHDGLHARRWGHLDMLQWVRTNDANSEVWDEHLVLRSAVYGPRNQEVLA